MKRWALLFGLITSVAAADDGSWQPESTWVFAVGVLQFDDPHLASWPDKGRVDALMLDAFRARGVPGDHITFIKDKEAHSRVVAKKLVELLERTAADDTLVFYYAGHGSRDYSDPARPVCFVTYDTQASWSVGEILDAIESHFHGSRALLLADCCHSGALAVEAAARTGRIGYGVLTSAQASARSTGNWTFTECLVDVLQGQPEYDLDHDSRITFKEAGRECDLEMAFCENQRAGRAATGGFSPQWVLGRARQASLPPRAGERCEGLDEGKWWKVEILDTKEGKCLVHWIGWDKSYDAWLPPDRMRPFQPKAFAKGAKVRIEWDKTWYPGRVLRSDLGLHLVHYDGYPDADDEWVPSNRLKAVR